MAQPATGPDHPDGAVEIVVGARGDATEFETNGAPDRGEVVDHGRSRRWVVVAVVAIVAVAGLAAWLLGRGSARPNVQVVQPFYGSQVDAPEVPARPIAQRWSRAVPTDRELVGIAVVDDTVYIANRHQRPRAEDDDLLVQALAATDGSVRWQETVPGHDTAVVLADDDTTTLLRGNDTDRPFAGAVAMLDPSTGTMEMYRDRQTGGAVRVRADGMLEIEDADLRLELVDPLTGETRLAFDSVRTPDGGIRGAWWSGDGWVVPTTGGWEITGPDGAVQLEVEGAEVWPNVFSDLVVHWTDSEVIARRRPSGEVAWRVRADAQILWVEPLDRSTRSGEDTGFLVHRADAPIPEDGVPFAEQERLLIEDGALVGPGGDDLEVALPDPWITLEVEVDGASVIACRQLPGSGVAEMCPEELALLGADEEVLAAASPAFSEHHDPSVNWRATDGGILTIGENQVRLYRWADLSEVWSIRVDTPWLVAPTVASSANGVAVAIPDDPDAAGVTWYG